MEIGKRLPRLRIIGTDIYFSAKGRSMKVSILDYLVKVLLIWGVLGLFGASCIIGCLAKKADSLEPSALAGSRSLVGDDSSWNSSELSR